MPLNRPLSRGLCVCSTHQETVFPALQNGLKGYFYPSNFKNLPGSLSEWNAHFSYDAILFARFRIFLILASPPKESCSRTGIGRVRLDPGKYLRIASTNARRSPKAALRLNWGDSGVHLPGSVFRLVCPTNFVATFRSRIGVFKLTSCCSNRLVSGAYEVVRCSRRIFWKRIQNRLQRWNNV